jgi:hypothetical protein
VLPTRAQTAVTAELPWRLIAIHSGIVVVVVITAAGVIVITGVGRFLVHVPVAVVVNAVCGHLFCAWIHVRVAVVAVTVVLRVAVTIIVGTICSFVGLSVAVIVDAVPCSTDTAILGRAGVNIRPAIVTVVTATGICKEAISIGIDIIDKAAAVVIDLVTDLSGERTYRGDLVIAVISTTLSAKVAVRIKVTAHRVHATVGVSAVHRFIVVIVYFIVTVFVAARALAEIELQSVSGAIDRAELVSRVGAWVGREGKMRSAIGLNHYIVGLARHTLKDHRVVAVGSG